MHIDRIPNRNSPPAYLLRESYREDGKVKKRTLANITYWPAGKIEALRRLLRDEYAPHEPRADLKLMRSLPHGHVAAALGMRRELGLDDLLAEGQRQRARMVGSSPPWWWRGCSIRPPSSPPRGCSTAPPRPLRSAPCWRSARSTSRNSTTRSIGSSPGRSASKPRWPDAISAMARWCSTT